MRAGRTLAAIGVALAVVAGGAAGITTRADALPATNTLYAGQKLVYGTADDRLSTQGPVQSYELDVQSDFLFLNEYARIGGPGGVDSVGTDTWEASDPTGRYSSFTDRSTLVMQADGNLVLYTSTGHPVWASHTEGTGTHNRLVLQGDGNLVIYTSANRAVWATGTTPVLLPAGQRLASGQSMADIAALRNSPCAPVLTMQTDGNLVWRCGTTVLWASGTGVRGSSLYMQTDGNLVMRSPSGTPLWASGTPGHGSYTWLNAQGFTLHARSQGIYWSH